MKLDEDALMVAMAVAPTVFSRNRYFHLHKEPGVTRARRKAAQLRGIVRELSGRHGPVSDIARVAESADHIVLSYRIVAIRAQRSVELKQLEMDCVAYLAARAKISALEVTDAERANVEGALLKLGVGIDGLTI